jgi:hypothetical protein
MKAKLFHASLIFCVYVPVKDLCFHMSVSGHFLMAFSNGLGLPNVENLGNPSFPMTSHHFSNSNNWQVRAPSGNLT